jgi:valyl-tRNA synthetase
MSKTKGNVVDPIEIIERFGTDAVRFTLASMASPGTDIAFSEARTEGYRAFANKIWNAARFTFMQLKNSPGLGVIKSDGSKPLIQELPDETPIETRWMFSRLSVVAAEVDRALGQYRFDEAANAVYQFFWGEFCDWYLELIKLRLDFTNEEQQNLPGLITLGSLLTIFGAALRLLSPFMPFITEEIWQSYPDLFAALGGGEAGIKSIALAHFPRAADFPTDAKAESEMGLLQELITTVRAIRKELAVPEKESAPIQINAATEVAALAQTHSDILARTCRVSAVEIAPNALTGNNARSAPSFDVAVLDRSRAPAIQRSIHGEGPGAYRRRAAQTSRRNAHAAR